MNAYNLHRNTYARYVLSIHLGVSTNFEIPVSMVFKDFKFKISEG